MSKADYVGIMNSIGGYNAVLMTWDEDFQCHTPYSTGFTNTGLGDGSRKAAIYEAKQWAKDEEIEYRGPDE